VEVPTVSETTLSAEVEAALELVGECYQRAWRDGRWKWVPLTAEVATLRTALERSARIEAAAKKSVDYVDHLTYYRRAASVEHTAMIRSWLRPALNDREDG
jgi:hypothetical protein